jgi:hypothetical protein
LLDCGVNCSLLLGSQHVETCRNVARIRVDTKQELLAVNGGIAVVLGHCANALASGSVECVDVHEAQSVSHDGIDVADV